MQYVLNFLRLITAALQFFAQFSTSFHVGLYVAEMAEGITAVITMEWPLFLVNMRPVMALKIAIGFENNAAIGATIYFIHVRFEIIHVHENQIACHAFSFGVGLVLHRMNAKFLHCGKRLPTKCATKIPVWWGHIRRASAKRRLEI